MNSRVDEPFQARPKGRHFSGFDPVIDMLFLLLLIKLIYNPWASTHSVGQIFADQCHAIQTKKWFLNSYDSIRIPKIILVINKPFIIGLLLGPL